MTVGLLIISHSMQLAAGVRELTRQMAGEVPIAVAGGTDDGEIGTSLERIMDGLAEADQGDGVLVLMDLGSAVMTAEMALDMLPEARRARVRLSNAPLVEGALAAGPVAATGAPLDDVFEAANEATRMEKVTPAPPEAGPSPAEPAGEQAIERRLQLVNPAGIHARPAAQLVQALKHYDAVVRLANLDRPGGQPVPAHSLVALLRLGAQQGHTILATASGPDAERAIDRIATLVEEGFGELEVPPDEKAEPETAPPLAPTTTDAGVLQGLRGATGTAIGPAFHLKPVLPELPREPEGSPAEERERLARALEGARQELQHLEQQTETRAGPERAAIFTAQRMMLDDPAVQEAAHERIDQVGEGAAAAWQFATHQQAETLRTLDNPLLAERAADLEDVGTRVIKRLVGSVTEREVPAGAVVLAEEITPAQVTGLAHAGVAAVATAAGGPTSHAIILARALRIPAVVALGPVIETIEEGVPLLVDGDQGTVRIDPPDEIVARHREVVAARQAEAAAERAAAQLLAETADGERVIVAANVASAEEARAAIDDGAEEIGLLRTESLYAERGELPTEEEESAWLRSIFDAFRGKRIIVRTLDVGGDKPAPALDLDPFRNGFLGVRGLRLSLERPDLFRSQLRAVLRAAEGHRVSLMFPMVTRVEEVQAARAHLAAARDELDRAGVARGELEEIGIMVEIPAAGLIADRLAAEVDFFSVGSNDLIQYTLAADRTNLAVATLYEPSHLAIARLLATVAEAATARGRWVGVCGEMAADPAMAALLVGLGIQELSMASPAIPAVKAAIREVTLPEARARAKQQVAGHKPT